MYTTVFLCFLVLFISAGVAESVCCDEIKHLVEKKDSAYKTLCSTINNLPANCCSDIALEVERLRDSYKILCETPATCGSPKALGMESGDISDAQITASSFFDSRFLPKNSRLNKNLGGCAWAPTLAGKSGSWHQVDLGQITHVTGVATQGCCRNSERMKSYIISYSNDTTKWTYYRESGSKKVFIGNTDQTTVVTHSFKPPILARYVRLLPQTWNYYPSLRLEYYGCR